MKVKFPLLKIYIGISLLILVSLLQTINFIDREVVPIIRHKTIGEHFVIFYDNNIRKMKQILPKRGGISYIGVYGDDYPGIVGTINIEATRFSLLPLVLSTNPKETHLWAVGHFPPGKEPQTSYISGTRYTLFKKFDNGFCLYKRVQ